MFKSDIFAFGVAPVLVYILGYLTVCVPLEVLYRLYPQWYKENSINHSTKESRFEALQKTQQKIPPSQQAAKVLSVMVGPTAVLNGTFSYFISSYFITPSQLEYPSFLKLLVDLIAMKLIDDFFLYWGHRIQHEVPFLFEKFHSIHHTLDTPTPMGTLYIDSVDATLQVAPDAGDSSLEASCCYSLPACVPKNCRKHH